MLVSQAVTVDLKERRKTVIPKGTPPGVESFDIGDGDGGPGDDDDDDGDYSSEDDDVEELPERNGSDADSVNGRLFYADGTESEIHKGKKKKDLIRHKEEATVVCPPFPSGTQLLAWRIQVAKNLAAASGRWDHKEIRWFFLQGSGEGVTFDSLHDSGELRFRSLDIKLSTSMGKVVRAGPVSLAAELQLKEQQAVLKGTMVMGRQIAFLIYQYYQTNPDMDFTYGLEDLGALAWHGDHNISGFLFLWTQITSRMKLQIDQSELSAILYKKMAVSTALASDLAHYHRQPAGSVDRSYKFLIHSMERHINIHQQEKNRANDITAVR
ncbi:hypothetical protein, partial [uncultured Marinobacter sp.]|uniref:hypothetical protein n=1 Tax=uncultured Marinobacter sp. TaxID=187379 RepID=UPI0025946FA1